MKIQDLLRNIQKMSPGRIDEVDDRNTLALDGAVELQADHVWCSMQTRRWHRTGLVWKGTKSRQRTEAQLPLSLNIE